MRDRRAQKSRGFTLIEIVIVLAIAALLLLIILLALRNAQAARRDFQRKNDLSRLFASIETYKGNTQNLHPANQAELDAFVAKYFNGVKDPLTGEPYVITYWHDSHDRRPVEGEIIYGREHYCEVNGSNDILNDIGTNWDSDHYMMIYQEQGGYFCLDYMKDH